MVALRPWAQGDAEHWVAASMEHWRRGSEFRFSIRDPAAARLLGGAGRNHLNPAHRFGDLDYGVRSSATGAGVASRAARLVAQFGLTAARPGRIEILTATDNLAIQRVAARVGANIEGVLCDRLFVRGSWIAARLYSLVRENLEAQLG